MGLISQVSAVEICGIRCGEVPFFLISGPCVVEERDVMKRTAEALKRLGERLHIPIIFKSSFQKDNRSASDHYRGPGLVEGLRILDEIRLYDYQLSVAEIRELAEKVTGTHDETITLPREIRLLQNFPNPFNPRTTIRCALPKDADVELAVFDLLGRQVALLVDERREAGWHSVLWDATPFASGVYLYRLRVDRTGKTGMMILMK